MRNLSSKIGIALLTFFVGTFLTLMWLTFEHKPAKSLETQKPLTSEDKSPTIAEPMPVNPKDPSYLQGKKDAERDVKDGKLVIRVRGVTRFGSMLDEELSKYKVKIQSIGCNFTDEDEKHLRGYNEVSKAAIGESIGKRILDKALRKAIESNGSDPS